MMKKLLCFILMLALVILPIFVSCENEDEQEPLVFEVTHTAKIEIENYGTIELELYGKEAPLTVDNFAFLANIGFYNGLTFHRIIEGFMMQGGGYDESGEEHRAYTLTGEFAQNGIENRILHERGVISMARATPPNSASCEFFIMHEDAPHLDGSYAAFGRVTKGIEIVDKVCTDARPINSNGAIDLDERPVIKSIMVDPVLTATHTAKIEIANYGTIELELYGNDAPITVANFEKLANSGFYEGLTFHRIIKGFMMQGGGYEADGTHKDADTIKGEFKLNGVKNPVLHRRGVISMARSSENDSASSQFFIMHQNASHLDSSYAGFGRVINGIDIVDKICTDAEPTDDNGSIAISQRPIITKVTVTKK